MNSSSASSKYLLPGVVLLLALFTAGCETHYYRAYDPDHGDYHCWNHQETVYYQQWTTENHMDAHRDYRHLSKEDQRRYWDWRHNHDRDHDRNRH